MIASAHCWVFDLDGTLTVHQHDFDAIRRQLGIPRGRLILEHLAGLPRAEARPLATRLAAIEAGLAAAARPAPGAAALLEMLARRGCQRGIVTRNSRDNALTALTAAGLDHLFEPAYVLGRDEAAPKPSPDGIRHLLACWRAAARDAVMVGDVHLDLTAGRNAGVATVLVNPDPGADWPHLADLRCRDLHELAGLVDAADG